MKRLSLIGNWKRLGLQVGLLAGVGVAFIGGTEPPAVEAAPICLMEGQCTFVKPMFMIITDYSTSMNTMFDANQTRWEAAVAAINTMIDAQNGYLQGNVVLGLMRFGHDPNAGQQGTTINNDNSNPKITDGQAVDVALYDANDPAKKYYECNGEAIKAAINGVPAPINGNLVGIGTWTKGALDRAKALFAQAAADHPQDMGKRAAAIVLLTDGEWTSTDGTQKLSPASANPSITAGDLWTNEKIPTYVVAIGEAMGKAFADELAAAGGTGQAIEAGDPASLIMALEQVVESIKQNVIQPVCSPGLPRIMILLDASSSMLNINNGTQAGPMGQTGWDQARDALSGANSLFDQVVNGNQKVENLVHLGLAVFGHNAPAPGEQKILVDYGPCRKDNFAWALDPQSSCGNGCNDPWGGPPITWTFQDGSMVDPPGFDAKTLSHMPKCDGPGNPFCSGSGTYTHLGLQLVQQNIATYKAACTDPNFPYLCDNNTKYINILVTDGKYNSTDAEVQGPLTQMYNNGITTYVIGFGDGPDQVQLNKMAGWGSGNMEMAFDANNQADLEMALQTIIEGVSFDPCCSFNDCQNNPEPTTGEPDPGPVETSTTSDGTGSTTDPAMTTDNPGTTTDTPGTTTDTPGTTTDTPGTTTDAPTTTEGTAGETMGMTSAPTTSTTGSTTPGNETGDESGDGSSGSAGGTGGVDDEGCGCSVDEQGQTRGLLASLFTLGLAGFVRRRRKAS